MWARGFFNNFFTCAVRILLTNTLSVLSTSSSSANGHEKKPHMAHTDTGAQVGASPDTRKAFSTSLLLSDKEIEKLGIRSSDFELYRRKHYQAAFGVCEPERFSHTSGFNLVQSVEGTHFQDQIYASDCWRRSRTCFSESLDCRTENCSSVLGKEDRRKHPKVVSSWLFFGSPSAVALLIVPET